jgi:hypothetical protein
MSQQVGGVVDWVHSYAEPARVKESQMKVLEEGAGDEMLEEAELSNDKLKR